MAPLPPGANVATTDRQRWMGLLSRASPATLEQAWQAVTERPRYRFLRLPETGLVMVRARAGGTGQPFNLGEMTMTRCAVEIEGGAVGFGYVAGRDGRHAELAAVFDALMLDDRRRPRLEAEIITPLQRSLEAAKAAQAGRAAATRVEFFTVVRGDG